MNNEFETLLASTRSTFTLYPAPSGADIAQRLSHTFTENSPPPPSKETSVRVPAFNFELGTMTEPLDELNGSVEVALAIHAELAAKVRGKFIVVAILQSCLCYCHHSLSILPTNSTGRRSIALTKKQALNKFCKRRRT